MPDAISSPLLNAILLFDLPAMQHLTSSLPASELTYRDKDGRNVLHRLAGSLVFFKAGELSSLVPWANASQTVYSRSVHNTINRALRVRALLLPVPAAFSLGDRCVV